ncbi:MAG: Ig-like domain-containing protein, partial [Verrucomicrobiota bacterium]
MYHPLEIGVIGESELEFLEIHNPGADPVNLGGIEVRGGIFARFDSDFSLPGGGYAVLASNPAVFEGNYGFAPAGAFEGQLSNRGEALRLVGRDGKILDELTYEDSAPWPDAADGGGASLERDLPLRSSVAPTSWQASFYSGGTPGRVNSPGGSGRPLCGSARLVINEIHYHPSRFAESGDWVELHNAGDQPIDLSMGWIEDSANRDRLPPELILPPGGFVVLAENPVAFARIYPGAPEASGPIDFGFSRTGDTVRILDSIGCELDSVTFGPGDSWPRAADGFGPSLSLIHPDLNNRLPGSWTDSGDWGGSPGEPNPVPQPDNVSPWVQLLEPAGGRQLGPGPVVLTAIGGDADGTLAGIDFFVDGELIGSDDTAPYSVVWPPEDEPGSYEVTLEASDGEGGVGESDPYPFERVAETARPLVRFVSPTNGAKFLPGSDLLLSVETNAPEGSSVSFYEGDTLIGLDLDAPFEQHWRGEMGEYLFSALVTTPGGLQGQALGTGVRFVNQPPSVTLTSPESEVFQWGEEILLRAEAFDSDDGLGRT